jgi:hypothetical protein
MRHDNASAESFDGENFDEATRNCMFHSYKNEAEVPHIVQGIFDNDKINTDGSTVWLLAAALKQFVE